MPCHKKDVFLNAQLGMAEKRGTMRFMQFCLDRMTMEREGLDVRWRNEKRGGLNEGRSLGASSFFRFPF